MSAEDQRAADERIPELLGTPAAVRFLSCEPLLGPVDLATHKALDQDGSGAGWRIAYGLHWVIVGGESGPGRRPCEVEWIADIVRQCDQAEVPVFVKQSSARMPGQQGVIPNDLWQRKEFPNVP